MLKRFLAIAALVCSLPTLASAAKGTLQIAPQSPGGNITAVGPFWDSDHNVFVPDTTVTVTSAYGTVYRNYSGAAKPSATISPNPGYNLTAYAVDGSAATTGLPTMNPVSVASAASKITATFLYGGVSNVLSVTASAGEGGSVNMTNVANVYKGQTLIYPMTFKFMPKAGYKVSGITGATGALINPDVSAAQVGQAVSVIFPTGYTFTGNVNVVAAFTYASSAATAKVNAPQTVSPGKTNVTLDGSASLGNITAYTWTYLSGPVAQPGPALAPVVGAPAKVTFTAPATVGTYKFKLTVDGGSYAIATVNVTNSFLVAAKTQCVDCHARNGIGGGYSSTGVYANWSSSAHNNTFHPALCANCHIGANTAGHPGPAPTNAICTTCHAGQYVAHGGAYTACLGCHNGHTLAAAPGIVEHFAIDEAACATCHETTISAAPHSGGTAFLKAQYVSGASLPVSCSNCHGTQVNTTAHQAILAQYTSSAHGSTLSQVWWNYDWRSASRASCQRCHAGTAFVARLGNENSTTNAYQATDVFKPGEVLNCSACHSDVDTGALRTAPQSFTINMTNGATVTYDVAGASTLCARCHGGRETGDSIKLDPSTTGIRGFINSHYLAAAGTLYNKGGYEYAGQVYDNLGSHKLLGAAGQGPCVTCHMAGKNHTFKAASCGTCHTVVPDVKANYDAALNNLKLALEAKGIYYAPVHPYFYTAPYVTGGPNTAFTNWAGVYGLSAWKDAMGAAFNYNLLVNEPGAFAHNYNYAMKLIADSIDFLSDGAVGP